MKYLLDTHTFVWLGSEPDKLSRNVAAICGNPEHQLIISVVSLWEIQIKLLLGKFHLEIPLQDVLAEQKEANQLQLLVIDVPHVLALAELPNYHKDPFDRMLVAQAYTERLALISKDPLIAKYPIDVVW